MKINRNLPFSLLLFFMLLLNSCTPEKVSITVPGDYRSWGTTHEGFLEYPIGGHTAPFRRVFLNSTAASGQEATGTYADGSIFIKESFEAIPQPDEHPVGLTLMIKDGENPDAVAGWLWVAVDSEGNSSSITSKFCVGCHKAANYDHPYGGGNQDSRFRDFIFLPPPG